MPVTQHAVHMLKISPRNISISTLASGTRADVITIPVVVHVVYENDLENISDAQVLSQIDVLNEDLRRLNADAADTPAEFDAVAADF